MTLPRFNIYSYCGDWLSPDKIKKSIERGWLLDDTWQYPGELELDAKGVLKNGEVLESKLADLAPPDPHNVVLLDVPINTRIVTQVEKPPLTIYLRKVEQEKAKALLRLNFLLYRLRLKELAGCVTQCCVCNFSSEKIVQICEDCLTKLREKYPGEFGETYFRIRAMAKMLRRLNPEANDLFQRHWLETLIPLQVKVDDLQLRVLQIRLLQDHYLEPRQKRRTWLQEQVALSIASESRIKERYRPQRSHFLKTPFLIACRRWNSWTPNQPQAPEPSGLYHMKGGGGYLLSDGFQTLAVDPGYGFLDMLFYHEVSALDIDAVLITHDHPDHAAELQNIMDLRYAYRKAPFSTKIRVLLNPSAFYLYERMLRYHHVILEGGEAELILPGKKIAIGNIEVMPEGMLHEESYHKFDSKIRGQKAKEEVNENLLASIISVIRRKIKKQFQGESQPFRQSEAMGLRITLTCHRGDKYVIVITGDTGFPPWEQVDEINKFREFYKEAHIASVHLGSLEREWTESLEKPGSEICYKDNNHLGLNGVVKFLNLTQPQTAVFTEFGEELDAGDVRLALTELVKELVYQDITIVPSDAPLFLAMKHGRVYFKCMGQAGQCQGFVPVKLINYHHDKVQGMIKYCFSAGCDSKLQHEDLQVQLIVRQQSMFWE